MADKKKGGRYTPKAGSEPKAEPAKARGRKVDPDAPTPQVGKRPSSPAYLFMVAALWIVAGGAILQFSSLSFKLVPGVFAIGVGLFFLRGALQTIVRHEERADGDE